MAPSLAMEVHETMRILAHGEAVRRDLRAQDDREWAPSPLSVALGVGGIFLWIATRGAPVALVVLGYAQTHGLQIPWGETFKQAAASQAPSLLLHGICLWYLIPYGVGALRVHEALRMPGRRALLIAQWIRWGPRALLVGAAFGAYQAWFAEGPGAWSGVAWMGCFPLLLGVLVTWRQVREASSPECRLAGQLGRATMGALALLAVGITAYFGASGFSPSGRLFALVPLLLGAWWGLTLAWFGIRGLTSVFRSARSGGFRYRVAATDLVVPLLTFTAVGLFLAMVTAPGEAWTGTALAMTSVSLLLGAGVVHVTLWLHRTRELPGLGPRPEAGQGRLPEEEERRASFPPTLLRGSAPRGFAAAWSFRRRVAMAPVVPWMLLGFMALCLWIAIAVPEMAWMAPCGVLLFPTYIGFGVSSRLHLLGAGFREQHLQNLRALAVRVALPAAVLCGLFLGLFGSTRERWVAIGLAGSALILRAGAVGFWRLVRHLETGAGLTGVLMGLICLPFVPPLFRIAFWFKISYANLAVFYASLGVAGLLLHLGRLDAGTLRDEMLREAEQT